MPFFLSYSQDPEGGAHVNNNNTAAEPVQGKSGAASHPVKPETSPPTTASKATRSPKTPGHLLTPRPSPASPVSSASPFKSNWHGNPNTVSELFMAYCGSGPGASGVAHGHGSSHPHGHSHPYGHAHPSCYAGQGSVPNDQGNLNYYMYLQSHHGPVTSGHQPLHPSLAASLIAGHPYGQSPAHVASL